jgi:hypothetical protein
VVLDALLGTVQHEISNDELDPIVRAQCLQLLSALLLATT